MPKKSVGLSTTKTTRDKQRKVVEVYAEQADWIGNDSDKDRQAKIVAVERAGYTKHTTDKSKLKMFMQIWKSDANRQHLYECWGIEVVEEPDPLSLIMRMLKEHMVQDDTEKWGDRDRGVSLAATNAAIRMFVPAQTAKVATLNMTAKIERPAEFDIEPRMEARTILPAGQTIAKPAPPSGDDLDEDEDSEDDD